MDLREKAKSRVDVTSVFLLSLLVLRGDETLQCNVS